jgi:hypothetical protein
MSEIARGRGDGAAPKRRISGWAPHRCSRSPQAGIATTARDRWLDPSDDPITAIIPFDRYGDRYFYRSYLRTISARRWALASSGWITLLCMEYLAPGSLLRTLVVFGFVLFCPGFAVASLLPTRESVERWVLAVSLSLSLGLLVSAAFTVMREDSITLRMRTLANITTLAVLADAVVTLRRPISFALPDKKVQR